MTTMLLATLITTSIAQPLPLTLDDALTMAVEQNHMLKVARARVAEAKGARMKSYSGFLPSVRVTEGWFRSNDAVNAFGTRLRQEVFSQADFDVARLNFPDAITNWQSTLEIRQPVFNGGASIAGRRAAGQMVHAAEEELRHAELRTRFQTAEAYWGVVLATEATEAVRQGLTSAREHAKSAEASYGQETISLPDVLAARLRVAELEAEEIEAGNRVARAVEGLTLMIGSEIAEVSVVDRLRASPIDTDQATSVNRALSQRPDLTAARMKVAAAQEGMRRARGSWVPHLNAFFDGHLDSDKLSGRQGESWTAGAILSWDLFSGGRTIGAMREASAQRDQASEGLAFAEAAAVREVRQTYREVTAAARRIVIAEAAVDQAGERHRITELQFREGIATTSDLLDAEAGLTEARLRRVKAMHDLVVGEARLRFVTGETTE